jgi:glucokinase
MRRAILVNGVPATGKSTVARDISTALDIPLLGLDTVKEALFSELGTGDRLYNRRMGRASYAAIWALVGAFPPGSTVVVDAWFGFQPIDLLLGHLARAGVDQVVEVWCHAAPDVVVQRYLDRCGERHEGHLGPDYAPELRVLAKSARPLAFSPVIDVDTTRFVNVTPILKAIRGAWEQGFPTSVQMPSSQDAAGVQTMAGTAKSA